MALGSGCFLDLVTGTFLLVETGSESISDSEADSKFVSSEFGGVDFFESYSDSLISSGGDFGFGLLWMDAMVVGFWEAGGVSAPIDLVVKRSSAPNPEPGRCLFLNPRLCPCAKNRSLWLG